jgi:hypothetical protein
MTMYKARYYKADGKPGDARALPDALFDGVVNEPVLHQSVKAYLSNQGGRGRAPPARRTWKAAAGRSRRSRTSGSRSCRAR